MSIDLSSAAAFEMEPLLRSGRISPVELVEYQLNRIAELDPILHSFISVAADSALRDARMAEREIATGRYRGPLHGMTVAHKDMLDVEAQPTTFGSCAVETRVARADSIVAAKLRDAGMIYLGKLNLSEFASGDMGQFGVVRNPLNLARSPGVSSSGSGAAVAAGLVTLATGTDTGGSIRNPACFCGVMGLRPTFGSIGTQGSFPLSWTQDTIGPLARSVADVALAFDVLSGDMHGRGYASWSDNLRDEVRQLRVGVARGYFSDPLEEEVGAAFDTAIAHVASLGSGISDIEIPHVEFSTAASWVISYTEAFAIHLENFRANSSLYTGQFLHKIAAAGLMTSTDRIRAHQIRRLVAREFGTVFRDVDIVMTPTSRILAPFSSAATSDSRTMAPTTPDTSSLTRPASLVGYPALSVPIGYTRDNSAIGMQLIGAPGQERKLFQLALEYERSTPWRRIRLDPRLSGGPTRDDIQKVDDRSARAPGTVESGTTRKWVLEAARLHDYGFITEENATDIALMLGPIREQLDVATRDLRLGSFPE